MGTQAPGIPPPQGEHHEQGQGRPPAGLRDPVPFTVLPQDGATDVFQSQEVPVSSSTAVAGEYSVTWRCSKLDPHR